MTSSDQLRPTQPVRQDSRSSGTRSVRAVRIIHPVRPDSRASSTRTVRAVARSSNLCDQILRQEQGAGATIFVSKGKAPG